MREEKMRKQLLVLFTLAVISIISFTGCEPFIENKITVQNQAAGDVQFIIAGKTYDVLANSSLVLPDFKKGTFVYETIYHVPFGITDASAEGDVAGNMVLNAGTEILLKYTSIVDTSKYTLFGILSSSDDVNRVDPFDDGETP
jgi:hypothetical protein